ncbi:MAG: translation initiation factor IF-3 [Pseudobdellovibrionaceae bacterium]
MNLGLKERTIRKPLPPSGPPVRRERPDPRERERDPNSPRINNEIRSERVRLVDQDGEMVGVVTVREAMRKAEEVGLDLVEISPNADPPVCKILDYGKFKYEQQKKAAEARKKQKIVDVKEIQIRPMIGDHDYEVKLKAAKRFLEDGDKVKVVLRFRGREMAHSEIGMELLRKMITDIGALGKTEMEPRIEGRQVMMVLGPAAALKVQP